MDIAEFTERYTKAKADVLAANRTLSIKDRRHSRSERVRKIKAEYMMAASTGGIHIDRIGITVDDAHALAREGLIVLYPDRFRKLEAAAPRRKS